VVNSPNNGIGIFLQTDDQLFIYETASILIVQSQFPAEVRISFVWLCVQEDANTIKLVCQDCTVCPLGPDCYYDEMEN